MIRRIAKIFAATVLGLLLIFLAINSWDENLKPEAIALIAQKIEPTEQGLKAYYYLLGLRIGDVKDPCAEGRALWDKAQKLPVDQRNKFFEAELKRKDGVWPSLRIPARKKGQPVAEFLKQARKGPDDLAAYKDLSDHYLRLVLHREYSPPEFGEIFSRADTPIQELLKGHRLLTLRLGELAEQKLYEKIERIIREENQFYQSFFGRSHLLGVMIAHLIIEENADILAAEKKMNPNLKFKPETLASFKTTSIEAMMTAAMISEFRFFAKMTEDMTDGGLLTTFSIPETESLFSLNNIKTRFIIKRNATVNRYYDHIQQELKSPCAENCLWDRAWWDQGNPIAMLRNPGGKWMTRILMINIHGRFRKMEQRGKTLLDLLNQLSYQGNGSPR